MKRKLYIDISLQHRDEIEQAIKYNSENNYKYILRDDNNFICYNNLAYLLRAGYHLNIFADVVELRHKNYNFDDEKTRLSDCIDCFNGRIGNVEINTIDEENEVVVCLTKRVEQSEEDPLWN